MLSIEGGFKPFAHYGKAILSWFCCFHHSCRRANFLRQFPSFNGYRTPLLRFCGGVLIRNWRAKTTFNFHHKVASIYYTLSNCRDRIRAETTWKEKCLITIKKRNGNVGSSSSSPFLTFVKPFILKACHNFAFSF